MAGSSHRPARKRALQLLFGALLAGLFAVAAVRCSRSHDDPPAAASAGQTQGAEASHAASAPPASPAPPARAAPGDPPAAAAPVDAGAPTTIGRLMRATDEHDRSLLAEIERATKQAPAQSALDLLELRRSGATRAELETFIQTKLQGAIPVRLAAMKWLRAIHGEPEPADDNRVLSAPGEPQGPRTVKPLTKKAP